MFTGLIDDVGQIERATTTAAGFELMAHCRYDDLAPGESIALNGACLTVRECGPSWFTVAVVQSSLDRTTIEHWRAGTRVNLERALRLGDRLGGHIVQGHVDDVGTVLDVRDDRAYRDARIVDIAIPEGLEEFIVEHGSIAVDGVSLTVNDLRLNGVVQVSLIDYTLRNTTLGALAPQQRVHLEADIVSRYVGRHMSAYQWKNL